MSVGRWKSKEIIFKKLPEIKNTETETKNTFDGLISRLDMAED